MGCLLYSASMDLLIFVLTVDMFFCLYILLFYNHLFFNVHETLLYQGINLQEMSNNLFKMGLTYYNGTMAEINIDNLSTICLN